MEQCQFAPCPECKAPNPPGHRFCGRCGATSPEEQFEVTTRLFGTLQEPDKASLVVIRGSDLEGTSFHLRAAVHELGRNAQIAVNDPTLSERHARFEYIENQLRLTDQSSLNGIYKRIDQSVKLQVGDCFSFGDQVFQIEETPIFTEEVDSEGTTFYGSPISESPLRVSQILAGGRKGLSFCPESTKVTFGRGACDINLFDDAHVSMEHCSLEKDIDGFSLRDLGSDNGTYTKIHSPLTLAHGDYLKVGQTVLRIEFNA